MASIPAQLTDRQNWVFTALADLEPTLSRLYRCALTSLANQPEENSLFLAAHAIREMTDELPKRMDVPILAEQGRLGDKVRALEPRWTNALQGSCYKDGIWSGPVDDRLNRLLSDLGSLFEWWQSSRPKRRETVSEAFRDNIALGFFL